MSTNRKTGPAKRLLKWYDENRRDLPWRGLNDPYAVWVSEIMLQQTAVASVIPYFLRWMKSFPNVQALAGASRDRVLSHWEGLGYYTRAACLHDAARRIVREFGGRFPEEEDGWRNLPGIGPYTSAAIMAFAFDRRTIAVDSIVRRVLFRYLPFELNSSETQTATRMKNEGLVLISNDRPGDSNQALMDLATAVCRPKMPLCASCPLGKTCDGFGRGQQTRMPIRRKIGTESIEVAVGIWSRDGRVYLQRRPDRGLFAGLWELPGGKVEEGESPEEAVAREFMEEVGVKIRIADRLPLVRHSYTKFRVSLHAFIVAGRSKKTIRGTRGIFVPLEKLSEYPQPAANAKIWKLFKNG
jgi:A/G-specific adenine glycosylase